MNALELKYKNIKFTISVFSEAGYQHSGWFDADPCQPFNIKRQETYAGMVHEIKNKVDEYLTKVPQTKNEWIDLFESCVIRTGYEDWEINEDLAMRVLELYKNNPLK